jgi:hypothetical protein
VTIWYVLEVSKTKPTMFRISVSRTREEAGEAIMSAADFSFIGVYMTPDELTAALEPYLHMEEGK